MLAQTKFAFGVAIVLGMTSAALAKGGHEHRHAGATFHSHAPASAYSSFNAAWGRGSYNARERSVSMSFQTRGLRDD